MTGVRPECTRPVVVAVVPRCWANAGEDKTQDAARKRLTLTCLNSTESGSKKCVARVAVSLTNIRLVQCPGSATKHANISLVRHA
jgi:hypothetical protein